MTDTRQARIEAAKNVLWDSIAPRAKTNELGLNGLREFTAYIYGLAEETVDALFPTDGPRYVWIVHYDNYGDEWIVGVFDSEDKTEPFKPKDPDRPFATDYRIEKQRLNPNATPY